MGLSLLVEETQLQTKAYAGKHHLATYTGRLTDRTAHPEEILLEFHAVDIDSGRCTPAHLSAGGGDGTQGHKGYH